MPRKFISCWLNPFPDFLLAVLSTAGENGNGEERRVVKFQMMMQDVEAFIREHHNFLCQLLTTDEFETPTNALFFLCRSGYVLEEKKGEASEFVVTEKGFQRGQEVLSEHFTWSERRRDFSWFTTSFNERFAVVEKGGKS
ncbi:MAG: hypothetical protein ABSE18_03425 [Minisyncoccia bacterium]